MYRIDIGIDLGTSKVCVYMRDKGIVINQPSVIAFEKKEKKILAVGKKAKKIKFFSSIVGDCVKCVRKMRKEANLYVIFVQAIQGGC